VSPGSRRRVVLAVSAMAVLVEIAGSVGWWRWTRIERRLAEEPAAAAAVIAGAPSATFPPGADRARRLDVEQLRGVRRTLVVRALGRLAAMELAWLPTDPVGWLNLARARAGDGELDAALAACEQALRRDPTSPYLHRMKALILMRRGEYDRGLDALAVAEGLAPGFRQPRVDVLPGDDQWVRLEGLRRQARLYPRRRVDALLALAEALRGLGREGEARRVLRPVAEDVRVLAALARWDLADGREDRALETAHAILAKPGLTASLRADAFEIVARCLAARGDDDAALEAARSAVAADPSSPFPYLSLADVAARRGDPRAALRFARRAWGKAPSDVDVLIRVGTIAERANAPGDARLAFERAAELAPGRPDVAARLVDFLLRHGDFMAAALRLSDALDRAPMDPRLLRLAARLRAETSR